MNLWQSLIQGHRKVRIFHPSHDEIIINGTQHIRFFVICVKNLLLVLKMKPRVLPSDLFPLCRRQALPMTTVLIKHLGNSLDFSHRYANAQPIVVIFHIDLRRVILPYFCQRLPAVHETSAHHVFCPNEMILIHRVPSGHSAALIDVFHFGTDHRHRRLRLQCPHHDLNRTRQIAIIV